MLVYPLGCPKLGHLSEDSVGKLLIPSSGRLQSMDSSENVTASDRKDYFYA